jgi:hypothetical protein
MFCQLRVLPAAATTRLQRLGMGLSHGCHYVLATSRRVWKDPSLIVRKARRVLGISGAWVAPKASNPTGPSAGLQPGERVRVKSLAEIQATLDSHHCYEGLHYTSATMDRYCGGTYTVLTRVDRFFDERSRRILKLKNTVLLDKVYCQPEPEMQDRIAGCKRMCFLFWKEVWLDRVDPGPNATK